MAAEIRITGSEAEIKVICQALLNTGFQFTSEELQYPRRNEPERFSMYLNDIEPPTPYRENSLDIERLASLVRKKRGSRGLRETAAESGQLSPSTLSRVENGKIPDLETFLALCNWLGISPAEFFNTEKDRQANTPEAIALHLQADPHLDPAIANALAALIKAAYRDLLS